MRYLRHRRRGVAERPGVHPGQRAASDHRDPGADHSRPRIRGRVVAVGDGVVEPQTGQRVAVNTIVFCGTCHWCRRGEVTRCPQLGGLGLHGDGGLAELCNAPARMSFPLPDTVADDEAPLVETLAVAVRALRRGMLRPGEQVAVVGAGAVGLMAVQAARAFRCRQRGGR